MAQATSKPGGVFGQCVHARRHRRHDAVRRRRPGRRRRRRADRPGARSDCGRGTFTVGEVKQALAGASAAQKALATKGVPDLKIRAGQHLGVFTDLHVERFGMLAVAFADRHGRATGASSRRRSNRSASAASRASWSNRAPARPCCRSTRCGSTRAAASCTVDRVTAQFDAGRRSLPLKLARRAARTDAIAALAGTKLGTVNIGTCARVQRREACSRPCRRTR